jgi:hypothetical protein
MMSGQETWARQAWQEIVCDTLKRNSIQLVTYVTDDVLKPLIKAVHEDSYFADHRSLHARHGDEGLDRSMP